MAKPVNFDKTTYDEYRAKGLSNTQIASKLGMSDGTLYAKLKQWKAENAKHSENKSDNSINEKEYNILYENRHEVLKYLKVDKATFSEIADKFNVTYNAVLDFVNKGRRFTTEEIRTMRNRLRNGDTEENIARDYETSPQIIAGIFKTTYTSPDAPVSNNPALNKLLSITDEVKHVYSVIKSLFDEYKESSAKLTTLNKNIQDILHKIEFDEYSDDETSLIVSTLREYRIERRGVKDFISLFSPMADLQASVDVIFVLHRLQAALLEAKENAKRMDNRVYSLKGGDKDE